MSMLLASFLIATALQQSPAPPSAPEPGVGRRPMTAAPRSLGPVTPMFKDVLPNWHVRCDDPGFVRQRVQFDITLDADGRIVSDPQPVNPQDDPDWQAAAAAARAALVATAPFDVPANFQGGQYRPTFSAAGLCARRQTDEP